MRTKFKVRFFIALFLFSIGEQSLAQILRKDAFRMQSQAESGLASNSITDILVFDNTVWFGTGDGLSRTRDQGLSFESFGRDQGLGKGGISALAVSDNVIWVATGFDTTTEFGRFQAGGGLAYSLNDGANWNFVPQPGATNVQNITFDIALRGDEIWITSFGGGLRKSDNLGQSWEIVTPDSFNFDPLDRLNHRAFAALSVDGVLWVGTALGVNRSTDGGVTWTNFNHQNQSKPLSGTFVVAIANQRYADKDIIWVASRETTSESEDSTEFRGVSWSEDQGFSWQTGLAGKTIHNLAFDDSVVYAASDEGLFKSLDGGHTWARFPAIVNPTATRRILAEETFSVAVSAGHLLWVGTRNGLAKTFNDGLTWEIFQVFAPTGVEGEPRTYAYPNPFSPAVHNQLGGDGHVRFQYNTRNSTHVTLKIFDFAMQLVKTVVEDVPRSGSGDFYEIWNGRSVDGRHVDNGVYFYRLELEDDGVFWGKLIVIK